MRSVASRGRLLVPAALLCCCVVGKREVKAPAGPEAAVLVGSAALGAPLQKLARHPWVALREAGSSSWERWEVMCCPESGGPMGTVRNRHGVDPLSDYGGGGGDVRIHGIWRGEEAERIIACVRERAPHYPYRDTYHAWPGPNSNTFVDWVARACDLGVDLPAPNIGKNYRGMLFGASLTSGGTGVQIETPLLGLKLGLTEGIEIHILGLGLGIDWWPPAILVPLGPGRLGFDDR